jgi:hypothetical protein
MSQTRIFDFGAQDLTSLLNTQDTGMLLSGVYLGYILGAGAGARDVSVSMVTNPNDSAAVIGVLHTRDGVTVIEDADLADLTIVAANDDDRIDSVVGVYAYNTGKPPNVMSYTVREGTPGTTAFVDLLSGATASIQVETFTTSADFDNWRVTTEAGTGGVLVKVYESNGTLVESFDGITRANAEATINGVSEFIWVTVLTAGSPGEPDTGQDLTFTGGVDPVPFTLGPNDYLLGRVYVRKNQATVDAVDIQTVEHLVASQPRAEAAEFELGRGFNSRVMRGLVLSEGTGPTFTSVSSGAFIAETGRRVEVTGTADAFSTTEPSTGTAKIQGFYVAYRSYMDEGHETTAGPTFFSAEGAEAIYAPAASAQPLQPTYGEVLAAAAAANISITKGAQFYYLGYRVVAKDSNGNLVQHPPVTGERIGERGIYEVHDGVTSRDVSSPYGGWRGLHALISDLKALEAVEFDSFIDSREPEHGDMRRDVEVRLRGFFIADERLFLPPYVVLSGPAVILPLVRVPLRLSGARYAYNGVDPTWTAIEDPDQTGVVGYPGSARRIQVTIETPYQLGTSLVGRNLDRRSGAGITVEFNTDPVGTELIPAAKAVVKSDWVFSIVLTTAEEATFNPIVDNTAHVTLRSSGSGARDLAILGGEFGEAVFHTNWTENLVVERLAAPIVEIRDNRRGRVEGVRCGSWDSWVDDPIWSSAEFSRYEDIVITGNVASPAANLGYGEMRCSYSGVSFLSSTHPMRIYSNYSSYSEVHAGPEILYGASRLVQEAMNTVSGTLSALPVRGTIVVYGTENIVNESLATANGTVGPYAGNVSVWPLNEGGSVVPGTVVISTQDGSGDVIQSGINPTILAQARTDRARIGNLSGMSISSVGRVLKLSGAPSGGNNGDFFISRYVSATEVEVVNPNAVAGETATAWSEVEPGEIHDDGNGNLVQRVGTIRGSVDYNTGDISVTFPGVVTNNQLVYVSYQRAMMLQDDSDGNLRDPWDSHTLTVRGTIDYTTGDYVLGAPSDPLLFTPTTLNVAFAKEGAVVVSHITNQVGGRYNSLRMVPGLLVLDGDADDNHIGVVDDVIMRNGTFWGPRRNIIDRLRGSLLNWMPDPAPIPLENKVTGKNRFRTGTASYGGFEGTKVTLDPPMPSTDYTVFLTTTSVGEGVAADVGPAVVLDTERELTGFTVRNIGWQTGGADEPSTIPTFRWLAVIIDPAEL